MKFGRSTVRWSLIVVIVCGHLFIGNLWVMGIWEHAPTGLGPLSACGQNQALEDSVLTLGLSQVQASFSIYYDYLDYSDEASISILGSVTGAQPPLQDVPVDRPGTEVTYVLGEFTGHVTGFWDGPPPIEWGGMLYVFSGGRFRLYADDTPDLDFGDPSTFADGELLLEGDVTECWLVSGAEYPCQGCYPSQNADVIFTGGALFPHVSRDGVGFRGSILQTSIGDAPLSTLLTPGYNYPTHGLMSVYVPVAAGETTWGRIKRLYSGP